MTEDYHRQDHWQAIGPAQNIAREYHLTVTLDLFGWTIVERRWGRIGCKGCSTQNSFPNAALAKRFVAAICRRRATAKGRIGVAYQPIS